MASFTVFLDEVGVETATASVGLTKVIYSIGFKTKTYSPLGVRPLSLDHSTTGAIKGAAWGMILAGPLGVAVGSMVGGGSKVAFELDTEEGEVLRCIASRGGYLEAKKQIERIRTFKAKEKVRQERLIGEKAVRKERNASYRAGAKRKISARLIVGMLIMPFLAVWAFLRRGYSVPVRVAAFIWPFVWIVVLASILPDQPAPSANAAEPAEAAIVETERKAAPREVALARGTQSGRSQSESMSFNECLGRIRAFADAAGSAPTNIVETNEVRMVRFPASDGSVLVTCSRADRKMVVTASSRRD